MYSVSKTFEISGCHFLKLPYKSKCTGMHGHNWIITVYCKSNRLNAQGMVVDFSYIKNKICKKLDHSCINEVFPNMNPTAECLAKWICDQIPFCYKVCIQESIGNIAWYEKDELHI